ncbi:MFS transporter [Gandjariella thermophila]|uniref:MFS transporter n=2 Tax=Gandjariella thermophila TaxID=1931992 RepID=A0A4D4J654_9PSEU|nr:MFS transporter [Gandjariella thermophila]
MVVGVAAAGFAVFALLYATQPVLPQLAAEFRLGPGGASIAVGAATGALALAVVPVAMLSEVVGRRPVMVTSVVLAALLGLALPFAPGFGVLVLLRVVQGVAIAGLPAVAMAYLAEQVAAARAGAGVGAAIGAMVAGNSAGGMAGRLVAGIAAGPLGWRVAVGLVGVFGAVCAVVVVRALPPDAAARAGGTLGEHLRRTGAGLLAALSDRVLLAQYAIGALAMSSFVALYNAAGFRLTAPPLDLPPAVASLVFLAYAIGGVSSALAGRLADRCGRPVVLLAALAVAALGAVLTAPDRLPPLMLGFALVTAGFFAAHSVAGGWVGARAPESARGQASGTYLAAYYLGSSVGGGLGTQAYQAWGWFGLVGLVCAWFALAALAVLAARGPARAAVQPWSSPRSESLPSSER